VLLPIEIDGALQFLKCLGVRSPCLEYRLP
jgi:hypothetical protein